MKIVGFLALSGATAQMGNDTVIVSEAGGEAAGK